MALNVQTAGDEAIYIPWPGYTGTPIPTSGKTIPGLTGRKELRRIYFGDVTKTVNGVKVLDPSKATDDKVRWAHKWRLFLSGDNCGFIVSCNGPVTQSGNTFRCKDGYTITAKVNPDSGYDFEKWSDGNTSQTRSFLMKSHASISASCIKKVTVRFFQYYGASAPLKVEQISAGSMSWAPNTSIRGWTFKNWSGNTEYGQPVYEDTDYYGTWEMVLSTEEFTVHKKYSDEQETYTSARWSSSGNYELAYRYARQTGHTTVLFNRNDKDVGGTTMYGYDIPLGSYMTLDLAANIKHTANPVNHYIKITCAILPNDFTSEIQDTSLSDKPTYATIDTAYKAAADAADWEVVTAPEEASAGGKDEFSVSGYACRVNHITNENGYIAVRCAKLTGKQAEAEDETVTAASCVVDWKLSIAVTCRI